MDSIDLMMDALWNAAAIRRRLVMSGLAIVLATCVSGCGGDDKNNDSDSSPTPIRGGDRLAWDQAAASLQQAQAFAFKLYVDNVESTLANTSCTNASSAAGYECSGRLPSMSPGRHVLELSSVLNGVESPRSAPFTVTVAASSQAPVSSSQDFGPRSGTASACVTEPYDVCYEVRVIATGLESVTALSAAPDGRVFFIEGDRQIRTIAGDVVVSAPALILNDSVASRIVGLATDAHFERTRSVFVAWTENAPDGSSTLSVTRYRELQNTLGEGATIVTGLPFRDGALAPLAVDDDGLLYIAMPVAPRSAPSPDQLAASGLVLRLTRDGFVPRANRRSSPILAEGYASPTGLAIDSLHGRVWLAGNDSLSRPAFASFSVAMTETTPWPIRPDLEDPAKLQGLSRIEGAARVPSLASPAQDPVLQVTGENGALLIATTNRLFRGSALAGGRLSDVVEVKFAANTHVLAATGDLNGPMYVVSRDDANLRAASILRLKRR